MHTGAPVFISNAHSDVTTSIIMSFILPFVFALLISQINCQESEINKNLGDSNFKEAVFTYPSGVSRYVSQNCLSVSIVVTSL